MINHFIFILSLDMIGRLKISMIFCRSFFVDYIVDHSQKMLTDELINLANVTKFAGVYNQTDRNFIIDFIRSS